MAEQSKRFNETHLKTKLLIDNAQLKCEEDYELLTDFNRTNKLLGQQLEQEKEAYAAVRQMVKQIKRDLAQVNKEKDEIRS